MIYLPELKGKDRAKWRTIVEDELGYDFSDYAEKEPYLYTAHELRTYFTDLAKEQGTPEMIADYYLDVEAMIRDEVMSGCFKSVKVDGQEYWARIY